MDNFIDRVHVLYHVAYKRTPHHLTKYGVITSMSPVRIILRDMHGKEKVVLDSKLAVICVACRRCNTLIRPEREWCRVCSSLEQASRKPPIKYPEEPPSYIKTANKTSRKKNKKRVFKKRTCSQCQEKYQPTDTRGETCPKCKDEQEGLKQSRVSKYKFRERLCPVCKFTFKPSSQRDNKCPVCGTDSPICTVVKKPTSDSWIEEIPDVFDHREDSMSDGLIDGDITCSSCGAEFCPVDLETQCDDCLSEKEAYE